MNKRFEFKIWSECAGVMPNQLFSQVTQLRFEIGYNQLFYYS